VSVFGTLLQAAFVLGVMFLFTTRLVPLVVVKLGRALGFAMKATPVTAKRLARFKRIKRGYYSFLAITTLFVSSLFLEVLVNSKPLFVSYGDRWAAPAVKEWAGHVLFFTNLSAFYKKTDFGQEGKGETDWNAFAALVEDPSPLQAEVDALQAEVDAMRAELKDPGPDASRGRRRRYERKKAKVDKKQAEVDALAQASANFLEGKASIIRTIYPYSPDDLRYALAKRPPNGPTRGRARDRVVEKGPKREVSGVVSSETEETVTVTTPEGDRVVAPRDRLEFVTRDFETEQATIAIQEEVVHEGKLVRLADDGVQLRLADGKVLSWTPDQVLRVERAHDPAPLGTDLSGRDVVPLLLYGFRISLAFALVVAVIGYVIGICLGSMQGYYGGWFDILTQRVQEIWGSIPFLFVIMIIAAQIKPTFLVLVVLLVVLRSWLGITYYIRGEFYREKSKDYVQAAIGAGVSDWKIMLRHILPNSLVPVVSYAPFAIVAYIGSLVSLDYLGFGLPPGTPSWGALLRMGLENVTFYPHLTYVPVAALCVTLFCVVMIGEAVREAFDPKVFSRLR
jgi:ABC-type microcin C transport system permease subunit YejE